MPKASKKSKVKRLNKSAWIRGQSATMAAKEVVAKAKTVGIKLSLAQVYTARSAAKSANVRPGRSTGKRVKGKAGRPSARSDSDSEMAFRRLALAIGLPKAEAHIADLKRSFGL
jgi:hypothetical protein